MHCSIQPAAVHGVFPAPPAAVTVHLPIEVWWRLDSRPSFALSEETGSVCSCKEASGHIPRPLCLASSLNEYFLTPGAQNCSRYLQQSLTRAFHGSIISLFPVEVLCPTHPRIPLAFCKATVQPQSRGLLRLLSSTPYSP